MGRLIPQSAARRTAVIAVLLGVLGVVVAVTAFGASTPSTPTITAKPANPTNVQATSFSFTGSGSVTFECSLDTPTFTPCTNPKNYGSQLAGSHTFKVRAKSGTKVSSPASYTWVIDLTAPAQPTVTSGPTPFPGWSTVAPSRFQFTGEAGATFLCSLDSGTDTPCSSGVSYAVSQQAIHTFSVKAKDAAGNIGLASTPLRQWRVDTIAPAVPSLTVFPDDPNGDGIADFEWTMSPEEPTVTYACQLENFAFNACNAFRMDGATKVHKFHDIVAVNNNQQHQFVVRATDLAGNTSQTAYLWKVLQSVRLTITGAAVGLLYPGGVAVGIDVVFHNPNNFPVYVNALDVTVVGGPGCLATNFEIVPQADIDATPAKRVLVGSKSTASVPLAQRPKIRMINKPFAQNDTGSPSYDCANKQISLDFYSASVTK